MQRLGIMVEGQEGLTWERWRRLCRDVEGLGFASLRRSDHLMSIVGDARLPALDCWSSLALAAEWTETIEFGPMVSPLTWHHPAVIARQAAAIDVLSGGRLILGVGSGWFAREHEQFGIPLPPLKQRMDNYEAGVQTIIKTWEISKPRPLRGDRIPLLLGGKGGEKRGLRIVASYADEWNLTDADEATYRHKLAVFLDHCNAVGRDPSKVRRSTLHNFLIGANSSDLLDRASKLREVIKELQGLQPSEVLRKLEAQWFIGTPDRIAEQMRPFVGLGVDLLILVHWLQDDSDALKLLATLRTELE